MNLQEIEKQARMLMTAHGVGHLIFEFDRSKKRIGAMHYATVNDIRVPRKITMSQHYAQLLQADEIRDTMLHEIAHALVTHKESGHGPVWRAKARELGAIPSPCKKASARPAGAWVAHCPNCKEKRGEQHRAPLRVYMCSPCRSSVGHMASVLVWAQNGLVMPPDNMPDRFFSEYCLMVKRYS